jgi:hypothetical protein
MTAEHFESVLNRLLDRKPFHVFTVELHGGERFEIDHPRAVAIGYGVAVFVAPGGVPVWFDHDSVNQIVEARASTDA